KCFSISVSQSQLSIHRFCNRYHFANYDSSSPFERRPSVQLPWICLQASSERITPASHWQWPAKAAAPIQFKARSANSREITFESAMATATGGTMSSQVSALRLFDLIQSHRV